MSKTQQTETKRYTVQCDVELQVDATSEEEARKKVKQTLYDLERYEETFYGGEIYSTAVIER